MNIRVLKISTLAVLIAAGVGVMARWFIKLIDAITNLAFFFRFSMKPVSPHDHHAGLWVLLIPAAGGLLVGLMARFGSQAIRGHGIPEAMEQVLFNQSKISPKVAILKPLSAAISIGTGGPFGAEGPIIATGGAIGSFVGQIFKITTAERKTLLAAGAAAGMTATFGTPVSSVLLAIELLLFEYRPSSVIPVALAAVTAQGVRMALLGSAPFTSIPDLVQPSDLAIGIYVAMGFVLGYVSVLITKLLYWIEDAFEHFPIHWMWWPAIGGLAVGVVGLMDPRTLGVGYENINHILSGGLTLRLILTLGLFKLISWVISLASGTSGGTLAPLFTIGGAMGGTLGILISKFFPGAGVDPRIAGLVGMAAVFTGASRAFLASVVFTFEMTRQPIGLLPLLGSCAASYLVSCLLMKNSIMTEKIARRGVRVPTEYSADFLDQILVRDIASQHLVALQAQNTVKQVREWLSSGVKGTFHQGYPVMENENRLLGVVTLRDLRNPAVNPEAPIRDLIKRSPLTVYEDHSAREAADLMAREGIGRLPVLSHDRPEKVVAMLTRSDLVSAHQKRLEEQDKPHRSLNVRILFLEQVYRRLGKDLQK